MNLSLFSIISYDCYPDTIINAAGPQDQFMHNKSWPYWETWKCIFGKDQATGAGAETVVVAAAGVRAQRGGGSECGENEYHACRHAGTQGDTIVTREDTPDPPHTEAESDKDISNDKSDTPKHKRKTTDDLLMQFLANLHSETNQRLELISSRIGYEFDLGQTRQKVFEKLGAIDGLSLDDRYELCNILNDMPQRLEVFMGMSSDARLGYLTKLMEEHHR